MKEVRFFLTNCSPVLRNFSGVVEATSKVIMKAHLVGKTKSRFLTLQSSVIRRQREGFYRLLRDFDLFPLYKS